MTAAAAPEPTPQMVAEINVFFLTEVDYDAIALEVMDQATNTEAAFAAMVSFAPALGLIEEGDL
ncbi:hypothetical protein ACFW81_23725 [Streptomyces angustmyceticus]|uniref:hypothetical protein n=1 Tax=Streptomyces angustmyceticus TaxID=285578 RepID=UPI0036A66CBC